MLSRCFDFPVLERISNWRNGTFNGSASLNLTEVVRLSNFLLSMEWLFGIMLISACIIKCWQVEPLTFQST